MHQHRPNSLTDASHSTSKSMVKFGKANTGGCVIFSSGFLKFQLPHFPYENCSSWLVLSRVSPPSHNPWQISDNSLWGREIPYPFHRTRSWPIMDALDLWGINCYPLTQYQMPQILYSILSKLNLCRLATNAWDAKVSRVKALYMLGNIKSNGKCWEKV